MNTGIRSNQLFIDDNEFFKESFESDKDDFDYIDIFLKKKKLTKPQMSSEEKSLNKKLVKKPNETSRTQSKISSSEESSSESDKNEAMKKIISSTMHFKRNANITADSSLQNIPFKINSSSDVTKNKNSIVVKLGKQNEKQKELEKFFQISDDDASVNEKNSKSYDLFKKESALYEDKIKEFTMQLSESKLAEKKAKWLNLDDFKSDDEESEKEIEHKKLPPIKHDKIDVNEVNNNYNETKFSRDDGIIEVNETPRKRVFTRKTIDVNDMIEARLEKVKSLNKLTEDEIEYMILRDINYYLDIFAGQCEHSWRHKEFKKYSKNLGNHLYCNSLLASFSHDQYMSAVRALQSVFCKNHHKRDEYIVKVLLPEALIKICMRIHQCSKLVAESYLEKYNFTKPLEWNKFKSTLST